MNIEAINSHDELAASIEDGIVTITKVSDRPIGNELIGDYIERIAGREALEGLAIIDADESASVASYRVK